MKKINFLAVLLCVCPMMMFGQLEVKPDGKTVVGTTGAGAAQLTVRCNDYSSTNVPVIGLESFVYSASSNSNQIVMAVDGTASLASMSGGAGTVIGVRGSVGSTGYFPNNGRNYGVLGFLGTGSQMGAAIFGSVNPYGNSLYMPLSDFYAGYFRGKVAITDQLNAPVISWSSDYRYKQNITELDNQKAVNNLLNLNP